MYYPTLGMAHITSLAVNQIAAHDVEVVGYLFCYVSGP